MPNLSFMMPRKLVHLVVMQKSTSLVQVFGPYTGNEGGRLLKQCEKVLRDQGGEAYGDAFEQSMVRNLSLDTVDGYEAKLPEGSSVRLQIQVEENLKLSEDFKQKRDEFWANLPESAQYPPYYSLRVLELLEPIIIEDYDKFEAQIQKDLPDKLPVKSLKVKGTSFSTSVLEDVARGGQAILIKASHKDGDNREFGQASPHKLLYYNYRDKGVQAREVTSIMTITQRELGARHDAKTGYWSFWDSSSSDTASE
ncbi:hypothetical protein BU24DRAFT_460203 [Aaosphaeria arxii CBS 175.79]|uniref:Uncharacterized protein n=1 Tax=Aaosphaeria arxii CBS 175.79 TaxID=1450172 RepID=A0A6A5XVX3_9PLEO|nr:uncharacterized protein BU24DRAFT_460203 [Aaosphaeria arxii CBS 175.79]KAF2017119.1 hypothetical protein BU24DRAFT_460203 [Aaosphaeria arxii CBS 175.79]